MTARLNTLGDESVGVPIDRAAGLLLRAYHHEHENPCRPKLLDQFPVTAERDHAHINAFTYTRRHMAAPQKRSEQVDGDRPVRSGVAHMGYRLAELRDRRKAERAKSARVGDRGGEFGACETAAHPGLDDGNVQAQPVK
jgi:hypothetical protein